MSDPAPVPRLPYIIVAILIYFAAYFAVTETALSSVSKTKVKIASEHGDYRADDALYALDNFDRAITTILICTNIIHISAASIVTVFVTRQFGVSWVTLSTFVTTLLVFFFGEMLPKSIAKKFPLKFTLQNAKVLIFFMKIFMPLSSILAKIGNFASKITKSEQEISITEDELHDIIEDMEELGTLDEDESDLIQSAMEFGDQKIGSIYTPRDKIIAVDISLTNEEILEIIKNQNHSRLPVYENNIDNIIGVLQIRDFIKSYLAKKDINVRTLLMPPFFVERNYNIDDILEKMSKEKYTLAIVKNLNSETVGIVSMEDILEELVGDMYDEDDKIGGAKC